MFGGWEGASFSLWKMLIGLVIGGVLGLFCTIAFADWLIRQDDHGMAVVGGVG